MQVATVADPGASCLCSDSTFLWISTTMREDKVSMTPHRPSYLIQLCSSLIWATPMTASWCKYPSLCRWYSDLYCCLSRCSCPFLLAWLSDLLFTLGCLEAAEKDRNPAGQWQSLYKYISSSAMRHYLVCVSVYIFVAVLFSMVSGGACQSWILY